MFTLALHCKAIMALIHCCPICGDCPELSQTIYSLGVKLFYEVGDLKAHYMVYIGILL